MCKSGGREEEGRFRLLPIETSITRGYRRCDGRVEAIGLKRATF
jgi:hypothetical protein